MTVSEFIFNFLEKKGCDTVYMVSGSSSMWLTDALYRNKRMKAICCHHEQSAAMAADCYGRVRGVPGICLATIGPGATNAITGVAGSYLDSSPMFILTGQANTRLIDYERHTGIRQHGTQSLNLEPIVSSIVKYFCCLHKAEDIEQEMEFAYAAAMDGRRGPVWIDIPIDLQNRQINISNTQHKVEEKIQLPSNIAYDIGKELIKAKKPLILAGAGVRNADSVEALYKVCEQFEVPVVTSRGGIDVIDTDSPYFIGRPGSYGDRASHFAIQQCDYLLILGSRLSVSTTGYYPQRFGEKAYKVMVDIDQKELDKPDVPVNRKICMDIRSLLNSLNEINIGDFNIEHKEWLLYCQNMRAEYPNVLPSYEYENPLNSYYFTNILSQHVSQNSNIIVDTGSVCNIVSQSWKLKKGQRFIISGGLSAMGFWAGAIGAIQEGRQVIALAGDGSVQMNVQEFATLKYYHLPVKLFIFQNHGYMLIRHNQHNYMNDRFLGVGEDSGVQTPDFCKVASAYGLRNISIRTRDELSNKICEVLNADEPIICQVEMQSFGDIVPRISSRVMPDGSLKAAEFDDLYPFLEGLK